MKKSFFLQLEEYKCVAMTSIAFIRSFHEGIQWSFLQPGRNMFGWSKPLIFILFEINNGAYFKRSRKCQKICSGSSLIALIQCCVVSFLNDTGDWWNHIRKKTKLHPSYHRRTISRSLMSFNFIALFAKSNTNPKL